MDVVTFYRGKRVLVTGHTGFKGSWLCRMLCLAGAQVTGYALAPEQEPSLYDLAQVSRDMTSVIGDIRDLEALRKTFQQAQPQIVFHLAAQPLVLEGYRQPVQTYETNVMGTVHVLECLGQCPSVRSFVNVTTDKVYKNFEQCRGYREEDLLGGFDPYSNSKACSELVTDCYRGSFFTGREGKAAVAISTARAGNVIGGGDFARDRILPDCYRAAADKRPLLLRNPQSVRPFQHVLEPLYAYMLIAARQYEDPGLAGAYNVGPEESDCVQTGYLTELFARHWGPGFSWEQKQQPGPHEAGLLMLDCSKLKETFSWKPRWDIDRAVREAVGWYRCCLSGGDLREMTDRQILDFFNTKE